MLKVLIADDHALIRQGLKALLSLEDDITVSGEAQNGEETLALIKQYKPDVVLMDINMPGMTGIQVIKRIKSEALLTKVILLTVENDKNILLQAIEIGADGYVLKDSPPSELIEGIKRVAKGENYIDKSLVSILFQKVTHSDEMAHQLHDLTERELEVLELISQGYSNIEIAAKLFLAEKTVKNNITRIFKKLEVKDRVQATLYAIKYDVSSYLKSRHR